MANTINFANVTAWTIPEGAVKKVTSSAATTSDKVIWASQTWKDCTYWNPNEGGYVSYMTLNTMASLAGSSATSWRASTSSGDTDAYHIEISTTCSNPSESDSNCYFEIIPIDTESRYCNDKIAYRNSSYRSVYYYDTSKKIDGSRTTSITSSDTNNIELDLFKDADSNYTYIHAYIGDDDLRGYSSEYGIAYCSLGNLNFHFGKRLKLTTITCKFWTNDGNKYTLKFVPITDGTNFAFRRSSDSIEAINYGLATKYFVS